MSSLITTVSQKVSLPRIPASLEVNQAVISVPNWHSPAGLESQHTGP